MSNRLAHETSPYLLQHQHNPVDWYPWGEEALARAREEDRPILLSVGYSACHWCHVMERESFEDAETAAYMNEHFVPIKVDREERPDVDAIYMEAVQSMTGQGGWPMTVFLDSDGVPFYGGTYFPPDEGRGMPSFRMVMEAVVDAYASKREAIRERAPEVRQRLAALSAIEPGPAGAGPAELAAATERLLAAADRQYGGFGGAPKFPPASALELLLARGETEVVRQTLDAMLAGGIYDQLGGGFARYAVDRVWLVPHFEKMLYDNALLARAYLHGWQALGEERYRRVCEETLDWLLAEMRGPEGGLYSALDADSEGEEGRYYVWFPEEIREVLGEEAAAPVLEFYGVTERGNFEGANVLHRAQGAAAPEPPGLAAARAALLAVRAKRVRPGLDDKRLLAWNALAISALAEAGAALGREDYLAAARGGAEFAWEQMRDANGHLLRTYKDGEARLNAYLEDHAFLLEALLTLYEAGFERRWFEAAVETAEAMLARFADPQRGGFFSTSADHEELIVRRKEVGDHPIPSGNSAAALGLLRLAAVTGERRYREAAEGIFALFAKPATEHPDSFAHFLLALDFATAAVREVALVGDDVADLAAVAHAEYRPHLVLAAGPEGSEQPPLLAGRTTVDGHPAAYVCENFACRLPVTDPADLRREL
ncbi:MAG: thioredoxin domain-containing protein [Actinobacteria bacterium]|nr:thioredoxin domain-containing protein [Actinomycetota bacterium]